MIAVVVVVLLAVLAAVDWWSSGRAQPLGRRSRGPDTDRSIGRARSEVTLRDIGGWGPGRSP
jgi:hypothetical protein